MPAPGVGVSVGLAGAVAAVLLGQRVDLQQRLHEGLPDRGGIGAARDRLALELGLHRLELVGVADPDGDGVLLRPGHEPRVAVVLGGAGLAGDHDAGDLRAGRGAAA